MRFSDTLDFNLHITHHFVLKNKEAWDTRVWGEKENRHYIQRKGMVKEYKRKYQQIHWEIAKRADSDLVLNYSHWARS